MHRKVGWRRAVASPTAHVMARRRQEGCAKATRCMRGIRTTWRLRQPGEAVLRLLAHPMPSEEDFDQVQFAVTNRRAAHWRVTRRLGGEGTLTEDWKQI